jgi:putative tryptophan/tyrosine transport system substrate-binding protein
MSMKRRAFLLAGSAFLAPPPFAQQGARVYRIGFLSQKAGTWLVDPLVAALRELGWVVGRNVQLDIRLASAPEEIDGLARDLVAKRVELIIAVGTHMALAASKATSTIPIVMALSGWPVEGGLVASYARPGGNITGLSTYGGNEKLFAKFMSLVAEMLPTMRDMGVLWDYVAPLFLEKEVEFGLGELERGAQQMKVRARIWSLHKQADFEEALAAMEKAPMQALFVTSGPIVSQPHNVQRIGELALRRRLPVACDIAGSTFQSLGTIAYSVNWNDVYRRCASFVDRILRGAKPSELPIEQPTNFQLVLNAGRAKTIGLKIPPTLLVRADRVID